jgi:UDP-N-acetylglucosamine--N-acetylmuramyl-(pentapeptide) pyrophosphoryl-undecaprenol N-acetylglucosamine transferase
MKPVKVLMIAGGTGGHIFPALAVADVLKAQGVEVFWLGAHTGLEKNLVPAHFPLTCIAAQRLRGKGWRTYLTAPWSMANSVWQAWRVIRRLRPQGVVAMGGFVSAPGGIAAKLAGVKLIVHEQNAVAGYTNRLLAKFADAVIAAYPGAFADSAGATVTGNPVRAAIAAVAPPSVRLSLNAERPLHILVLGGSQGAHALNELVTQMAAGFPQPQRLAFWHQTGKQDESEVQARYATLSVTAKVQPFITDMAAAYEWADLLICRAGALTIAEIAAVGVASLLVPFPAAVDDHQWYNARYLEQAGAAVLIRQADLSPQRLAAELETFLSDRPVLLAMAKKARELAQPQAAETVAEIIMEQVR